MSTSRRSLAPSPATASSLPLSTEHAAVWYGISADTLQRGLDELHDLDLHKVWQRAKKAPRTRFGYTRENHYALQGPFVRAPIDDSRAAEAAAS